MEVRSKIGAGAFHLQVEDNGRVRVAFERKQFEHATVQEAYDYHRPSVDNPCVWNVCYHLEDFL